MTALPTRKLESYRYADTDALGEVWSSLAAPEHIEIAAQQKLQQIWLPGGDEIDVRRLAMVVGDKASARVFALLSAPRYARLELDVTLGAGADFQMDAAMIGGGSATLDIVTIVRHAEPDATSRQSVRSVLGGRATGSYQGKIAVARGAQRTDAVQSVKAMLLDRGASANAKPELEIYADDVKCAHGATVGELDAEQLFYAAARGLPPAVAKALLLEGFVGGLWDALGADSAIAVAARDALREVAA
ncbi:SufD family Fe-S cluster assembly protein [Sphingomonas mesophila]|uniref:SufD family Fe-S cluster assembly protein n=1 Tax=Sphingomonas mesophila TaxID=2303576 RepID=UPI000E57BC41|nr:SufD family Fe-S cluster assembly protein [Sphingomonas mesophila]